MSARRFSIWILVSVGWLVLYGGLYMYCALDRHTLAETLKTLIPFALAIPAAIIAAAFNRRNSYLQALRELWRQLIPAAQSAIQYTHIAAPDQTAFGKTHEALSTAIDLLRGVFANVPKAGVPTGLYPYENLKDIQKIISWLGFGDSFKATEAPKARACITKLWQEMHGAMLDEFDRDVPIKPVSRYLLNGVSIADLLIDRGLKDGDLSPDRRASHPR